MPMEASEKAAGRLSKRKIWWAVAKVGRMR